MHPPHFRTASFERTACGLSFETVRKVLSSNPLEKTCALADTEAEAQSLVHTFLQKKGMEEGPIMWVWDDSCILSGTYWELEDGVDAPYLEYVEGRMSSKGGWIAFQEETTKVVSLTTVDGARLRAEKSPCGQWKLCLKVPVGTDDVPKKGHFWTIFHEKVREEMEATYPPLTDT